jgi:hypothetical protein
VPSQDFEILGFLKVETMFKNRLNDTYHVQILAAFADQMYTFLSLRQLPTALKAQKSGQPPQIHQA